MKDAELSDAVSDAAEVDAERRKTMFYRVTMLLANFVVFCAAALMLCFVLWVASCTLNAMKGV